MDALTSESSERSSARSPWPWLIAAGVLAVLVAAVVLWRQWGASAPANPELTAEALDARLLSVEQSLAALKRGQETLTQRQTDTQARTGLLRDEVLGLGQRAAIVEDNVRELSSAANDGAQELRLDEAELLLGLAQARLNLAGDLEGAVRASQQAEAVLATLVDPRLISLRQSLAQEIAALRALPADPRRRGAGELDALQAALPQLAGAEAEPAETPSRTGAALDRLLDALVQVRPDGAQDLLAPGDRVGGEAALAMEMALARIALEQRDDAAFRASLLRIERWLDRLYADSPLLRERKQRLHELSTLVLKLEIPLLGSSLQQLRELRRTS